MSEVQKAFQTLQPYLIGIRYVENTPVIDVKFKEGWFIPKSEYINKANVENEENHFMLFSETKGIGVDELLGYLDTTIKANIEREKKTELFKEKVNELKEVFNSNPLIKLKELKFSFNENGILSMDELHLDPPVEVLQPQISVEEAEMIEEENRAANFKKLKKGGKIELPPKKKIAEAVSDECTCGPDQACSRCIDEKGL